MATSQNGKNQRSEIYTEKLCRALKCVDEWAASGAWSGGGEGRGRRQSRVVPLSPLRLYSETYTLLETKLLQLQIKGRQATCASNPSRAFVGVGCREHFNLLLLLFAVFLGGPGWGEPRCLAQDLRDCGTAHNRCALPDDVLIAQRERRTSSACSCLDVTDRIFARPRFPSAAWGSRCEHGYIPSSGPLLSESGSLRPLQCCGSRS